MRYSRVVKSKEVKKGMKTWPFNKGNIRDKNNYKSIKILVFRIKYIK